MSKTPLQLIEEPISRKRLAWIEADQLLLMVQDNYEYPIDLDRIDTPQKVLGWLMHLGEKDWFTTEHMNEILGTLILHDAALINRNM